MAWYQISSRDDQEQAFHAEASRITEYVDFQFQSIKEISHLLRISEYAQKYLLEDPASPDRYSRLKLYRFISSIFGIAPSQKNAIAVTKIVDDYAILNNSTGNLETVFREFHITRSQLEEAIAEFQDRFDPNLKIIRSADGEETFYTVICREWMGQEHPLYILISYTEAQLLPVDPSNGAFAIISQDVPVATAGSFNIKQFQNMEETPAGYWNIETASVISGFSYQYLASEFQPAVFSFVLLSLAGVVLISLSILSMYLVARRMYSPIAETLVDSGIQVTSGNEFSEIKKAFSTLSSDVETMSNALSQYRISAENKFFHDLFTGVLMPEQAAEQMRNLGLSQEVSPFTAVLIRYVKADELAGNLSDSLVYDARNQLTTALYNLPSLPIYRVIDLNFSTQGLIIRTADRKTLEERLRNLLFKIEPDYGIEMIACIGEPVDRLSRIPDSYRVAARLSAQNEFSPVREKVITMRKDAADEHSFVYYPMNLEQSIISSVLHGKTSVWQTSLEELMAANSSPDKLPQLAFMLTSTVNRIIDGVNETVENIFPDGTIIYLEFRTCASPDEFTQKAYSIFSTIADHLERRERQSAKSLEQRMTGFLEENYSRDISLLDLAEYLNMSKNYVSTLFKNLSGKNFKDYLSEFRYKKACSLIAENPDKKIREIAEAVGCSPDILHRLFLRYGGITPSDYQRNCRLPKS